MEDHCPLVARWWRIISLEKRLTSTLFYVNGSFDQYIYIFFPHGAEKESVQFLRNTIYQTPMKNENVCPRQSNLDSRSTSKAGWSIPNLVTRAFLPESSTLYEQVDCVSLYWSYWAFGTAQKHIWLLRPSAGSPLPCCGEARPQMSQLAANS